MMGSLSDMRSLVLWNECMMFSIGSQYPFLFLWYIGSLERISIFVAYLKLI